MINKKIKALCIYIATAICIVAMTPGMMVKADDTEQWESDGQLVYDTVEGTAIYPELPELFGKAAILMDADTGTILYQKNAYDKMYPASITKIMTALLAIEKCQQTEEVTYTSEAIDTLPWDASRYGVVAGETVTIKDSLRMLMLVSANEVANGLALHISGSLEDFGQLMTERAKKAGALNTNFTNPSGLHDDEHYTTAYDMAMIVKSALNNTTFVQVWGSPTYVISPTNKVSTENKIWHTHRMLVNTRADYYSYAKGGKTGYTDEAGRTLVTFASKNGMNLIAVVLKSDTEHVCEDTKALFEFGFNNFKKVNAATDETRFGQAGDSFFVNHKDLFEYSGKLLEIGSNYITIPNDADLSDVGYILEYSDASDDTVVTVRYYIGDYFLGKTSLTLNTETSDDVGLAPDKVVENDETEQEPEKDELPINIWWILGGASGILIIALVIFILKKTKTKRKIKKERKKIFKGSKLRMK